MDQAQISQITEGTICTMRIGEIYFIRERDRRDGATSSYVKIGMVGDTDRGSHERLSEHQTGNPRDLELHHVTKTPNPFRVERFLHQRFGPKRVRNEWFDLEDNDLDVAVRVAEQLAEEAFVYLPVIEAAKSLALATSNPAKVPSDEISAGWHQKLMTARAALKLCGNLRSEYLSIFGSLSVEDREEVDVEELVLTETYSSTTFDQDGFSAKYPNLVERFTITNTKVSGRFTPAALDVDLQEVERELVEFESAFLAACQSTRTAELKFADLFDLHQEVEKFEGAYQWDEEVADAHLRVMCGTTSGIEGLCTWNRLEKVTRELDKEALESSNPEEFNEFRKTELKVRTKTKKRARRQQ
jgi:hypothetical protein